MKGKTIILVGLGLVVLILLIKRQTTVTRTPSSANSGTQAFWGGLFGLGSAVVTAASSQPQAPSQVNTDVQTTEPTDAQTSAFTEGHFGVDYTQL